MMGDTGWLEKAVRDSATEMRREMQSLRSDLARLADAAERIASATEAVGGILEDQPIVTREVDDG